MIGKPTKTVETMQILFYGSQHSLPSFAQPRQPKERFDPAVTGNLIVAGDWADKTTRPLRETSLWPMLNGLSMVEFQRTLAHVAALVPSDRDSGSRTIAEHVSVLISNGPKTDSPDDMPRIVDENGIVLVDVLWTDRTGYVDASMRSARFHSMDPHAEVAESYRWYRYFVDQLGKAKESANEQIERAKRHAALFETIP